MQSGETDPRHSRGKKVFRKFSDGSDSTPAGQVDDEEVDVTATADGSRQPDAPRRITRSSIQPRRLFPLADQEKHVAGTATEDEEATTDIEDDILAGAKATTESVETPLEMVDETPDTPMAPRFAPASPPTTDRAVRTGNKAQVEETPVKRAGKPRSPFDGWRRSKNGAKPHGQKREAEPLRGKGAGAKRQRA